MVDDIQYNNLDVIDASLVEDKDCIDTEKLKEELDNFMNGSSQRSNSRMPRNPIAYSTPYVIELQYGAQMRVRFEAPTAEEVIRLAKLYEEK